MADQELTAAERLEALKAKAARISRGSPDRPPTPEQVRAACARMLYGPRSEKPKTR